MKLTKLSCIIICICFSAHSIFAQGRSSTNLEKVSPQDFSPKCPVIDSSADAVVLADIGSTDFDGSNKGDFTLVFKLHERILLKSRNAFDVATVKVLINTYNYRYEERFEDFEAVTYNLENGHVTETKIDKAAIFKEKYNRYYTALKFTLPNIKEGCIIEYKYTIRSPFQSNDIRSWSFQREYPVLWSEYKVTIPPLLNYAVLKQGFLPYAIDTAGKFYKNYTIVEAGDGAEHSSVYNFAGDAKWAMWAIKDAPAFKHESYLTSSKNYISKIKFQLHSIRYSDTHTVQVIKSWFEVSNNLLKDPDFGEGLSDPNGWLDNDLKKITEKTEGYEKAKKIFEYVRDNFSCTSDDDRYLSNPLKKTYQNKKGNIADINMLLTAMLINQGFDAHPVLLSTKDNGQVNEASAILNQYNYLLSRVKIDTTFYLLDASVSRLGFGKLPEKCYNGSGRLIDKLPLLVPLSTEDLSEAKNTLVFIANDEKEGFTGSYTSNLGYFESLELRDKIAKTNKDDYLKKLAKEYASEMEISNLTLDSLKRYDDPVAIKFDFKPKLEDDIIYFNPMLNDAMKNNPFSAAQRLYPVEMPYKINETYILNMEVPKGYKIDELPKSARVNLNGTQGIFEYLLVASDDQIQFRCRIVLNKATFEPVDYQTLRDFYAYVVKKEAEQIVFKKK